MTKEKGKTISKKSRLRVLPPLLSVAGIGIAVVSLVILWRQDPSASPRTIISSLIEDRPYIPGVSAGLTLGGIVMAFFLSSKETQKRCVKAGLTVFAAFLVFVAPTYLLYALKGLAVSYSLLVSLVLALFVVGLFLLMRLIKAKE